jgi:hypothetical protein
LWQAIFKNKTSTHLSFHMAQEATQVICFSLSHNHNINQQYPVSR